MSANFPLLKTEICFDVSPEAAHMRHSIQESEIRIAEVSSLQVRRSIPKRWEISRKKNQTDFVCD